MKEIWGLHKKPRWYGSRCAKLRSNWYPRRNHHELYSEQQHYITSKDMRYTKIIKMSTVKIMVRKWTEKFAGTKIPFSISLLFLAYCNAAVIPVINPITHAKMPKRMASVLIYGLEAILMVKCKEVVKKPTPIMEMAVRIQARNVLSFARCCWANFTLPCTVFFWFSIDCCNSNLCKNAYAF